MIEQVGVGVAFYAHFVASKTGKTGLTVTVDVWRITEAGVATEVVTGGSATEIGDGLYRYGLSAASVTAAGEYISVFKTADSTVDAQHMPAVWTVGHGGIEHLDAAVSSRNAVAPLDSTATQAAAAAAIAAYDPPTKAELDAGLAALPDDILDDEEVSAGVTVRQGIAAAGAAGDPLTNPASGYTEPQIGYYMQRLANNQVEIVSVFDPVTMALRFRYGDDYAPEESRSQTFTTDLDLTGASVVWNVRAAAVVTVDCDVVDDSTYSLTVTAADLEDIGVGEWAYDLEITLANGHTVTEVAGTVTVTRDIR